MVRDVTPLSKVSVGPANEITPISKIPGALSHVIYSTSSVASSHVPYTALQMQRRIGMDDNDISIVSSVATPKSSTSSISQIHIEPRTNSSNPQSQYHLNQGMYAGESERLHVPALPLNSPLYNQPSSSNSNNNGSQNHNPFNPVTSNMNTNLLISSANYFPS